MEKDEKIDKTPLKVGFHTLGCKVNQYETQMLKEKFREAGFEIAGESEFAQVYIINTCTVTGLSDRKSRQFIRRAVKINPDSVIAVIGCFAQVNPEEASAIPGVSLVIGANEKNNVINYVLQQLEYKKNGKIALKNNIEFSRKAETHVNPKSELKEYEETGIITSMDSRRRGYIKVQEGCDRFCSYCIIPYARGPVRSRKTENILLEAQSLLDQGFKEIILTGINTALYRGENGGLEELILRLNQIDDQFRIRIGSLEPTVVDKEYAVSLLKYDKLCHHFHLSVQSGSDKILEKMNRQYTQGEYFEIVRALRERDPLFGITTDIIVGFPGESEQDFENSLELVRKSLFTKVHVFKYSARKGTPAAELKDQISSKTKSLRSAELIKASNESSIKFFEQCMGITERVLIESYDEKSGCCFGYGDHYIPIYCKENLKMNKFYKIVLKSTFKDGIIGEVKGE